ncbi:MAG TPA: hypothetical protein VFK02_05025 [Kofleriaceae bacterium]|nr:hypothetical protein [Kofleriaceae bacterium]
MYRFTLLTATILAAFAIGCAGSVGYTASASSAGYGPDLVYVAPGVQVIADYDEPIFFADSFYWRLDGARWYRSSSYTGGWVYAAPPSVVLRIDRPRNYVRYRPQGWVAHRERPQAPGVRDHRAAPPRSEPVHAPPRRAEPPSHPAPPPERGGRRHERPSDSPESRDDGHHHGSEEHR